MGSVKDLKIIKEATENEHGIGRFVYSDRYSVFDWGQMPDDIKDKGTAICMATAYFFEKLEEMGIKTHYIGIVEDGKPKKLNELNKPQNVMEVKLVRVVEPEIKNNNYDYSVYKSEKSNYLIPIEIIYRNSLPPGSSVFKRLENGSLKLEDIGLTEMPRPGDVLKSVILDVSTKLESTDRYISWEEAREISGLSKEELNSLKELTLKIADLIKKETEKIGLVNEDGKIELGLDADRNLMVVDALGTLDECRFTYNGIPVSKEIARIHYRGSKWHQEVEEAKKKDKINWKRLVKSKPEPLTRDFAEMISSVYKSYVNGLTGKKWFEVPDLKDVLGSEKIK